MIVPRAAAPRRRRQERPTRRRFLGIWPAVLVGIVLAAAAGGVVGALTLGGGGGGSASPPRPSGPVRFVAESAYDPLGDGQEHDDDVQKAVDSDPATFWETENYRSFDKAGVGLALQAARPVSPKTMTVITDTPGFTAEIKAGDSPSTAKTVADPQTMGETTTFQLKHGGRWFVIWITDLGDNSQVHVNEAHAR